MAEEYEYRHRNGIRWQMITKCGTEVVSGFTIDNLDKKTISEAENKFEEIFILVRQALEENQSRCMDVEEERLHCTQAIANAIKKGGYLR